MKTVWQVMVIDELGDLPLDEFRGRVTREQTEQSMADLPTGNARGVERFLAKVSAKVSYVGPKVSYVGGKAARH